VDKPQCEDRPCRISCPLWEMRHSKGVRGASGVHLHGSAFAGNPFCTHDEVIGCFVNPVRFYGSQRWRMRVSGVCASCRDTGLCSPVGFRPDLVGLAVVDPNPCSSRTRACLVQVDRSVSKYKILPLRMGQFKRCTQSASASIVYLTSLSCFRHTLYTAL